MSNRGTTKPSEASRKFTIFGTQHSPDYRESLNDPTRKRRSSEAEAHRAALFADIRDSLARRCPMQNVKGDIPTYEELPE